ncbi:MAG: tRNA 2-thiocytidine biosynthesis protein TtcA [Spirochaetales bacterium]|nr:tRNA 2-thiocytidine biosynthesis protein TtcA [Spirochaetales bacterium]
MASYEQLISKRIGQALYKYRMIRENDRIVVAVSGGKDSTTMLYDLNKRQKSFPIHYELEAVHIKMDFSQCSENSGLEKLFKEWGVRYHIIEVPVQKRVRAGKRMNCYWCSTQRRIELLKMAEKLNCNKIAIGHHLDDIIETFFMNMCYKGELAAMLPVFTYHKFPYTIIRPLALVYEKLIIKFAQQKNIGQFKCTCPYGGNSKRLEVKKAISILASREESVRYMIFKALHNVNLAYLKPE